MDQYVAFMRSGEQYRDFCRHRIYRQIFEVAHISAGAAAVRMGVGEDVNRHARFLWTQFPQPRADDIGADAVYSFYLRAPIALRLIGAQRRCQLCCRWRPTEL